MTTRLRLCFDFRKPLLSFYSPHFSTAAFHPTRDLNWNSSPSRKLSSVLDRGMNSSISSESTGTCDNIEYMPLEDVEKLERYRPGGYHPIAIGDHLHGRYDIVHKLGFGTYSTTWLAKDQKTMKYVAVKIAIAAGDLQESKILQLLGLAATKDKVHPGEAIISPVLDEFFLHGPNGKHRCFVTVPAMMSLAEAKDASYTRLFRLPVAKAIATQIVQAVAFLHDQGIVHADLHAGNILLRLPESIDNLSPEQLYEIYGQPNVEPIARLDSKPLPEGAPTHGVVPVWLGKESELVTLSEARIFLTDFGESFLPSTTPRHYSNTPAILVPPEVYFVPQTPLSFPTDIWTLACTLWSIIGQRPLFEGFNPSADWMIKENVDTIGKLPSEWWQKWDARLRWFSEEGRRNHGGVGRSLVERFNYSVHNPRQEYEMEDIEEDEKTALLAMLRAMLVFKPEGRLTAAEILETEWMQKWALPVLEKV